MDIVNKAYGLVMNRYNFVAIGSVQILFDTHRDSHVNKHTRARDPNTPVHTIVHDTFTTYMYLNFQLTFPSVVNARLVF